MKYDVFIQNAEFFLGVELIVHNILYKFQFGFCKGHSAQQALITLVRKLTKALDIGDHVIDVYLNLKKAFDTVDHDILLRKLYKYGIIGNVWHLIKSQQKSICLI